MRGMKGIRGCLDLTVFQDEKPIITYYLFPRMKLAFRKFRSGEKKGTIEETDYNFAFELCCELCNFRANGRRVEGTFVRWIKRKEEKGQVKRQSDMVMQLFRKGKVELSGLIFTRRR